MEHSLPSASSHIPLNELGAGEGDSSSGGSDAALGTTPDPVSAQLINNITMLDYRSLGNTSPLILNEEELSKSEGISATSNRQLPHFVTWNWNLIRNILFWGVLSALLACLAAVIALVATLPRSCNPQTPWYQGNLFYEVFPASFQDSNGDGVGDIRGLLSKIDYIQNLGVKAVRLNSIFRSEHYPERYRNITSLTFIDKRIGSLQDVVTLAKTLHHRNMSLLLDLPVYPYITQLEVDESQSMFNQTQGVKVSGAVNVSRLDMGVINEDRISLALKYWSNNGVDGFYLKGVEHLVDDVNFCICLENWKKIIGKNKILMVNYEAIKKATYPALNMLLFKVDLVDVHLDVTNGSGSIMEQVNTVMKDIFWAKPSNPWVHWSVGSVETRRISSVISPNHTLAALVLNMMLPGTPSIFYGDEIALKEMSDVEEDFHESRHIHNIIAMEWGTSEKPFTSGSVLAWAQGGGRATKEGQEIIIQQMSKLRSEAPPIYANAVWREGIGLPNAQVRFNKGILVIERWYPRRNSYVLVVNMGDVGVQGDLSSWFYGGAVSVATSQEAVGKEFRFKALSLQPAEAMVIKLDK